jgi:hypothetical protein
MIVSLNNLKSLMASDSSLEDYTLVVLTRENNAFISHGIERYDFDLDDHDLNLFISQFSPETTLSEFIQRTKNYPDLTPLFIREIYDSPIVANGMEFTHMDTPIHMYAIQDEKRQVGLFVWFEEIESLYN